MPTIHFYIVHLLGIGRRIIYGKIELNWKLIANGATRCGSQITTQKSSANDITYETAPHL